MRTQTIILAVLLILLSLNTVGAISPLALDKIEKLKEKYGEENVTVTRLENIEITKENLLSKIINWLKSILGSL